ncbi:MAG: chemotaxis protein CheD [Hyphomicrobiaceae bacterium]
MNQIRDGNRIHVLQGDFYVTSDPDAVLTTVLGSCIAACFHDPVAKVGGMNHYLLPTSTGNNSGAHSEGVHLMELLLNGLLGLGAQRDRIVAKIFGGAKMIQGSLSIGDQNAQFAQEFLQLEEIPIISSSTGGDLGRSVQFRPFSGHARQRFLSKTEQPPIPARVAKPIQPDSGELDLF